MKSWRDGTVAVLMGGPGSERAVSLASGAGVAAALRSIGVAVAEVDVRDDGFVLPPGASAAFNVVHGTYGEDGGLQAELERRGVRYTGEGVAGSRLAFDKIASKQRFAAAGVPTAEFEVIPAGAVPAMVPPLVVKAPREGSSVGVYIVREAAELPPALEGAARYAGELLVERFVAGRELTVGILGDEALPVIEIRPKEGFYDYANKYPFLNPQAKGADHLCPAPLEAAETALVQEVARAANRALGLEAYCRVDVLLGADGPCVLEINTIPGMTPSSLLPEAAAAAGVGYAELCARILDRSWGLERGGGG
jgi:D-alanine-D-alanine ligase